MPTKLKTPYRRKGKLFYRKPVKTHNQKGGKVRGETGQTVNVNLHGGEFILPRGVKPTVGQKRQVRLRRRGRRY